MAATQTPDEPNGSPTPGEARREGLRKSRWVAAGVAVGAAAFLTGVIAGVNGGDDGSTDSQQISAVQPGGLPQPPQYDDDSGRSYDDDSDDSYDDDSDDEDDEDSESDDFDGARPFDPRSGGSSSGAPTQQAPSGPQSRSGGS